MPGPGGGRSGGGFSGGGMRGGFSGGYVRPPSAHMRHTVYGGNTNRYEDRLMNRGCLRAMLSACFFMVIVIIVVVTNFSSADDYYTYSYSEGEIIYDEYVLWEYADENYQRYFADSSAYEDNLLLVFLADESRSYYYTIAWIGDNIVYEINEMFGETEEYGDELYNCLGYYYDESLGTDLATVMYNMADHIVALNLPSSFETEADHSALTGSYAVNKADFEIDEDALNASLKQFAEMTGIPAVVVIDEDTNVFAVRGAENEEDTQDSTTVDILVTVVGIIIIAVIGIAVAVVYVRKKKKPDTDEKDIAASERKNKKKADEKPPWEF